MKKLGRGICASLAALFLVGGLSLQTAWAKAFDMEMVGITITAKNPADQAGPTTFYFNREVKIECKYKWGEFYLKNPPPPLQIHFFIEPPPEPLWNHVHVGDIGPPAATGTVGSTTTMFKTNTIGTIKVGCEILKKSGVELNDANVGNNKKEVVISVKLAPKPGGGLAPNTGPVMPTQPKGLPDITSGTGVVIGGKSAPWGSSVTVDVKSAHSVNMNNSGLCEFAVKHTARNIGLASTGPFGSVWKTSNVPSSGRGWLPIAAGGSKEETDLVRLKPGQNLLHLTLDDLGKVQESNEGNNRFRIIVNVAGICGPKPGIVPPPAGGLAPKAGVRTLSQPPGPPNSPPPPAGGEQSGAPASPRLPAVQQKAN